MSNKRKSRPQPPAAVEEWVLAPRELLDEARNIAMEWTLKGRVPECGKFGQIAQDLDAILAAAQPPSALMGVEDGPIDASDNAEYIEHCADVLERRGLRVTAGALRVIAHEHRALAKQAAAAHEPCAAVAAIQFALTDPEGMTFLRLWNGGEFDTLRREWPDAPSEVYVGADPLAQQPAAYQRSTHHVHRATESLPCYCHAKDDHPIGSEQPVGMKTLDEFMVEQEALHPGIHDKVQAAADELRASLASPPSAPVAADWITGDGLQGIKAEAHFLTQHKDEAVQRVGKRLLDRADKIIAALYQPSSAPVGTDAPGSRAWMAEVCRAAALSLAAHGVRNDQLSKVADWIAQQPAAADEAYPTPRNRAEAVALAKLALAHLGVIDAHIDAAIARCETDFAAQQPAAVDRARFRKAPCYLCGYNGPGYFQPETHPCAANYHTAQPGDSDNG